MTIQPARISHLRGGPSEGRHVIYWMQQSQRCDHNPALVYAAREANRLSLPLRVVFGLTGDYPEANGRHFRFMLQGLQTVVKTLADRGIGMKICPGDPCDVVCREARDAALVVCDVGYTRVQRRWRECLADRLTCPVTVVEGDVVVPVAVVSDKAEYAARTIRPRIHRHLDEYLRPFSSFVKPDRDSLAFGRDSMDIASIDRVLETLKVRDDLPDVSRFFRGGEGDALKRLDRFLIDGIRRYDDNGNQPQTDDLSGLSPYLHFGQISPVAAALAVQGASHVEEQQKKAYIEQLIVRRELAVNFTHYTPDYDAFTCLPEWARITLEDHSGDHRNISYDIQALEASQTHDLYWNAAMTEMRETGYMHNYMRMYWGKKILEWTPSPHAAFETLLTLNNRYFLDGRDPNSFAGVAWIFGRHDRAWKERPIFGKVRYMAASGLERKCDIKAYVRKVEDRVRSREM